MNIWNLIEQRANHTPHWPAHQLDDSVLTYQSWRSLALRRSQELSPFVPSGAIVLVEYRRADFLKYAVDYLAVLKLGATVVPVSEDASSLTREEIALLSGATVRVRMGVVECLGGASPASSNGVEPAEIIFTSGTTGSPRGWACYMDEICSDWDLSRGSVSERGRELHAAAIATNYMQEMLRVPLLWGSHVITTSSVSGALLAQSIDHHQVNTLRLTPTLARALIRSSSTETYSCVDNVSVSSSYCPPELLDQLQETFPNARIVNQYSLTESGRAKLKSVWGESPRESLGQPVENTEVKIVDDAGQEVPGGVTGELQLRHVLAPARKDVQVDTVKSDWIATGDLGYQASDNYIYLVDRARDLIHVGGRKVSPLAIERVLLQDPAILDICVVGRAHPTLGEVPVAAVELSPLSSLRDIDMVPLASHERPVELRGVDEIPRNTAGKFLRPVVRSLFDVEPQGIREASALKDGHPMISVLEEILEIDTIDVELSWFGAGGDSLSAVEVMTIVEEDYGIDLDPELFGADTSIRELLRRITSEQTGILD